MRKKNLIIGLIAICIVFMITSIISSNRYKKYFKLDNLTISENVQDKDFSKYDVLTKKYENLTIKPDVRIFTAFAFLNSVVEFRHESDAGMSDARKAIIADLTPKFQALDKKTLNNWTKYFKEPTFKYWGIAYHALNLGTPSNFNYIVPKENIVYPLPITTMKDFNKTLGEFYNQFGIEKLYFDYMDKYFKPIMDSYKPEKIVASMNDVYNYLKYDSNSRKERNITIIPNPFDFSGSVYTAEIGKDSYFIVGANTPTDSINFDKFLDTAILKPLVLDFLENHKNDKDLLKQYVDVFNANKNAEYVKDVLGGPDAYIVATLTKAIQLRMDVTKDPSKEADVKTKLEELKNKGLILTDYFYNKLSSFESGTGSFKDFLNSVLSDYKYKK